MLTDYCRPYVKANVGTRLVATDACRKNELHPAIYLQDAERAKEHVTGNHLQNRKHIGYRNYQRSGRKRTIKQNYGERKGKYKRHGKRAGRKLRPVARSN